MYSWKLFNKIKSSANKQKDRRELGAAIPCTVVSKNWYFEWSSNQVKIKWGKIFQQILAVYVIFLYTYRYVVHKML